MCPKKIDTHTHNELLWETLLLLNSPTAGRTVGVVVPAGRAAGVDADGEELVRKASVVLHRTRAPRQHLSTALAEVLRRRGLRQRTRVGGGLRRRLGVGGGGGVFSSVCRGAWARVTMD